MPRYICKLDDLYFEWSTIVDAPITYGMTLEEFAEHYRSEYGESGMRDFSERMERVEQKGTSSHSDASVDELISWNRAGDGEQFLSKAELIEFLKQRPDED
jgi:hypothetical protein